MGEKLLCKQWIEHSKEYFMQNNLEFHMIEHPLGKECLEFLLNKKFVGYSNERLPLASAYLEILNAPKEFVIIGRDFSTYKYNYDFTECKYAIQFNKDLSKEQRIESIIHEMTHVHYLEIQFVTESAEMLITEHARQFASKNKEYCKELYYRAMNIWRPYTYKENEKGLPIYAPASDPK